MCFLQRIKCLDVVPQKKHIIKQSTLAKNFKQKLLNEIVRIKNVGLGMRRSKLGLEDFQQLDQDIIDVYYLGKVLRKIKDHEMPSTRR